MVPEEVFGGEVDVVEEPVEEEEWSVVPESALCLLTKAWSAVWGLEGWRVDVVVVALVGRSIRGPGWTVRSKLRD